MQHFPPSAIRARAFSLVELLVVMGIIILMAALIGPALNSIRSGGDLTKTASDLSDVLAQARAHAMARNTYVYVGFKETKANDEDLSPGDGRLNVAVMASTAGPRPTAAVLDDTNVKPVSRVLRFESVALRDVADYDGGMARKTAADDVQILPNVSSDKTIQWDVRGRPITFDRVIEFDPQGVARIPSTSAPNSIDPWIEIPLKPARGETVLEDDNNAAALQVDGMTGSVRIFRPQAS